jgi:hypothetical protein
MATSRTCIRFFATAAGVAFAGCVVVNPSNVSVSGFNSGRSDAGPPATPYASALRDVIDQQAAVRTEINDRDWVEANEEIDDWVQDTRKLIGYADTSRDPARFRAYGNELLAGIERLRTAVNRQDGRAAMDALNACDPILDKYSRDFPLVASSTPKPATTNQPQPNRSSKAPAPQTGSATQERKSPRVP